MYSSFVIPVAVVGDPEAIALRVLDKVTVQQYRELPVGADFPLIDTARRRILCIHKHGTVFDVNEAHVIAELDEYWEDKEPPFPPLGKLTDEEIRVLARASGCPVDTAAAPVPGRREARATASKAAARRRNY
jgi:hypothetical protein